MKKFILLSLILHLVPLLFLGQATTQIVQHPNPEETQIEVVSGHESIKEIGDGDGNANLRYFWGIGISADQQSNTFIPEFYGLPILTEIVTEVNLSYSAFSSGIEIGDIIYLIDDKFIAGENQIRGDSPRRMRLTILRKSRKIIVNIDRVKVYY